MGEKVIYAIRHSDHTIESFISLLKQHGITAIVDLRSAPLTSNRPRDCYQRENHFVASWDWKIVENVSPGDILGYCEDDTMILHSNNDRVDPEFLKLCPLRNGNHYNSFKRK